ncbi:proteasome assembly chaperone family protein [Halobacteriales archaeon Cl-PHB]
MDDPRQSRPTFHVNHEASASQHLLAGFSTFGLAGLTAANYLVEQLDLTETGHVSAERLPAITPFEDGTPRHHTRLFSRADADVTVLVNELFVPPWAAEAFSTAVLDWTDDNGVAEVTVLSGVPVAHGPTEHRAFSVATEDYQASRLADADLPAMGSGFLDGVNASLVSRGMDSALRVGVVTTPVHAKTPDVEAAIRLVDAAADLYDLAVDTADLEAFAADVDQYYEELAARFQQAEEPDLAADRMYM